jgi:uncharacterized protein YndB with AHSA1/START domain
MERSDKQIIKAKILHATRGAVWQKWTTREGLLSFFGKDNKIEITPGGPYEIYFILDNPEGLRGSESCIVLSFVPKEMLSFTWNAPPVFMDMRNAVELTWVVLSFREISNDLTEIVLKHVGWPDHPDWVPVYDYFVKAWDVVLNNLEKSLKK